MTIKARTGLQPEWYTPVSEQAAAAPARFKLRPMTSPEFLDLRTHFHAESKRITGKGIFQALGNCIQEWEGVTDAEGRPLTCTPDNVATLPPALLQELLNRLVSVSNFGEAERKN